MTGTDGNVFALIGRVGRALRLDVDRQAADEFVAEAFACTTYDEVLQLIMRTVHAL